MGREVFSFGYFHNLSFSSVCVCVCVCVSPNPLR